MALVRNFAMTPEEIARADPLPPGAAWMSCHFAGTGITDLPKALPAGSLLILNDRIPPEDPDPQKILSTLTDTISALRCQALLLDLERRGDKKMPELIGLLQRALPCPVGVSELYSRYSEGPVFLPLLPAHKPLADWLSPWQGREIWLEVGPAPEQASVTAAGTTFFPPKHPLPPCPHRHEALFCHYGIQPMEDEIRFTLYRTPEDLKAMTRQAEALGVTRTIGLYQELF